MGPKAPGGCGLDFRASLENVHATFLFYPIVAGKLYTVCQKTCRRRPSGRRWLLLNRLNVLRGNHEEVTCCLVAVIAGCGVWKE